MTIWKYNIERQCSRNKATIEDIKYYIVVGFLMTSICVLMFGAPWIVFAVL